MSFIFCIDVNFFASHPFVFTNSTSFPKLTAMIPLLQYRFFTVLPIIYVLSFLFSTFWIFSSYSLFNIEFPSDSAMLQMYPSNVISANDILLSIVNIFSSFPFSNICIPSSQYVTTFCFLYFIFSINEFEFVVYVYIIDSLGVVLAFSTDIVFTFDSITVPLVFISTKLRYLLSFDIATSVAIVVDKYVLNSYFQVISYIIITDLYVVPVIITPTAPLSFTQM